VRSSNAVYVQASKRIGLVLFAVANIYAVMRPTPRKWAIVVTSSGRMTA